MDKIVQEEYDLERTKFLKSKDYSKDYNVLRFWNHEVLHEMNAVL